MFRGDDVLILDRRMSMQRMSCALDLGRDGSGSFVENILRYKYFMYMDGASVHRFQGTLELCLCFVASLLLPFFDRVVYGNPGERYYISRSSDSNTDVGILGLSSLGPRRNHVFDMRIPHLKIGEYARAKIQVAANRPWDIAAGGSLTVLDFEIGRNKESDGSTRMELGRRGREEAAM